MISSVRSLQSIKFCFWTLCLIIYENLIFMHVSVLEGNLFTLFTGHLHFTKSIELQYD